MRKFNYSNDWFNSRWEVAMVDIFRKRKQLDRETLRFYMTRDPRFNAFVDIANFNHTNAVEDPIMWMTRALTDAGILSAINGGHHIITLKGLQENLPISVINRCYVDAKNERSARKAMKKMVKQIAEQQGLKGYTGNMGDEMSSPNG